MKILNKENYERTEGKYAIRLSTNNGFNVNIYSVKHRKILGKLRENSSIYFSENHTEIEIQL